MCRGAEIEAHIDHVSRRTNTEEDHILLLQESFGVCQESHLRTLRVFVGVGAAGCGDLGWCAAWWLLLCAWRVLEAVATCASLFFGLGAAGRGRPAVVVCGLVGGGLFSALPCPPRRQLRLLSVGSGRGRECGVLLPWIGWGRLLWAFLLVLLLWLLLHVMAWAGAFFGGSGLVPRWCRWLKPGTPAHSWLWVQLKGAVWLSLCMELSVV